MSKIKLFILTSLLIVLIRPIKTEGPKTNNYGNIEVNNNLIYSNSKLDTCYQDDSFNYSHLKETDVKLVSNKQSNFTIEIKDEYVESLFQALRKQAKRIYKEHFKELIKEIIKSIFKKKKKEENFIFEFICLLILASL